MTTKRNRRLIAILAAAVIAVIASWNFWWTLPDVSHLERENPGVTALMRERGGKRIQDWMPLDDISPRLIQATLMGEDASFFAHSGFDVHEMKEAFKRNWEEGRTVRGASTITQQVAKNLFLSTERTYTRKLKEALLAHRLEEALTKERILEIYLNVIEWGKGVYGAEAAAQDVFGKSASHLDATEAATLAAMIPNPSRLDPCVSPKSLRVRRDRILGWMHMAEYLSDDERRKALAATPRLRKC